MGKGRDKRRRKTKGKDEVSIAKGEPLSGEPLGPFDPYAPVFAPLKPKPSLRSGGIALPEPEESESFLSEAIGVRLSK
jgi:hypothetical protein